MLFDLLTSALALAFCELGPKVGIAVLQWPNIESAVEAFRDLFQAATSLLGFVLASVTFLASHVRQPEFKILRQSKSYPDLISLFASSLWRLALLMAASATAVHIRPAELPAAERAVLFLATYSLSSLVGLIWITIRIIRASSRSNM